METHADEAVLNNVVGTRNLAEAAIAHRAAAFVLISTDKAVNPSSIMGATKRVAERYVQTLAADPARGGTVLCAVRFGNVLGSSGSVVPLFKKQIERGGPITVTHPDMTRYFMTIPEAVQLVLRAATLAEGGEIFVLEMGEPVRIADMARDLVRLSGLEIGVDIDIVFTGLRPGERLTEELWSGTEDVEGTVQDKLLVIRQPEAEGASFSRFLGYLSEMEELAKQGDIRGLIQAVRRVVPEYQAASPGLMARRRVLIADEDPGTRRMLRDALDGACEIIEAHDGSEALTRARSALPDVVLLANGMPRLDGPSICAALRADARTHRLPIIMLSRPTDVPDRGKALSLGADDHLSLPVPPEQLRGRIDALLGRAYAG
jgi:CheY-like chemotaxis protein